LNGSQSFGVPNSMLQKIERVLMILLALDKPYNVLGLSFELAKHYTRARDLAVIDSSKNEKIYEEKGLTPPIGYDKDLNAQDHVFVIPKNVGTGITSSRTANGKLPLIHFNEKSYEEDFKISVQADDIYNIGLHQDAMEKWYEQYFTTGENIYVGKVILPFNFTSGEAGVHVMSKLRVTPIGLSHDAYGIVSHNPIRLASVHKVVRSPTDPDARFKCYAVRLVPGLTPREWGQKIVEDASKISAYKIHPPRFMNYSVSQLVPKFKNCIMMEVTGDNWSFVSTEVELSPQMEEAPRGGVVQSPPNNNSSRRDPTHSTVPEEVGVVDDSPETEVTLDD